MKLQTKPEHGSETFEKFSTDALLQELELFRGPQSPKVVVSDFFEKEAAVREEDVKAEGTMVTPELSKMIKSDIVQHIRDYVSLIVKTGRLVYDEASEEFAEQQLRVAQVRTGFDFQTWIIKMLFIIDADPAIELSFSQLLKQIEKLVLLNHGFVAELNISNKRDHEIDPDAIRSDYPFVGKVRVEH